MLAMLPCLKISILRSMHRIQQRTLPNTTRPQAIRNSLSAHRERIKYLENVSHSVQQVLDRIMNTINETTFSKKNGQKESN